MKKEIHVLDQCRRINFMLKIIEKTSQLKRLERLLEEAQSFSYPEQLVLQ